MGWPMDFFWPTHTIFRVGFGTIPLEFDYLLCGTSKRWISGLVVTIFGLIVIRDWSSTCTRGALVAMRGFTFNLGQLLSSFLTGLIPLVICTTRALNLLLFII